MAFSHVRNSVTYQPPYQMSLICQCRYEFDVSIPLNYNRRLDVSSRVIAAPDAKVAPAEGVLGQTLAPLYGGSPLDSAFDQSDMNEIWDPEEADHIHHSAKLESFLSHNFHVSSLFADDAVRSNYKRELEHVYFEVGSGLSWHALHERCSMCKRP